MPLPELAATFLAKYKGKIFLYGGILILLTVTHSCAYITGRLHSSKAQAKAEAVVLKNELERNKVEAEENVVLAEETGRETAEMNARLERALGDLNEAIENAKRTGCDLTDAELSGLQAIRDSYQ